MQDILKFETLFTRCRHILKTVKNLTVAKFQLAFTRCRNNLKTVGNLTVKKLLQDSDVKEMYLHPKKRSVLFQKRRKMLCFHHFRVCTRCRFQHVRLEFRFHNLPFSKSADNNCAVFNRTGGLFVQFFTVFKMGRHRLLCFQFVLSGLSGFRATAS